MEQLDSNNGSNKYSISVSTEDTGKTNFGNGKYKEQVEFNLVEPCQDTVSTGGKESGEYDPYDHCTSKKPTTYWDSILHYVKTSVGTGILALPSAFKETGYTIGVAGVIFVSFLYAVCVHELVLVEYELCRRKRVPNLSYANTVYAAFAEGPSRLRWFAHIGKFFANFFFVIYESGGCAAYIIFIASNLKQLIHFYYQTDIELRTLMAFITLPIVFLCWTRNLKIFVPLSAVANVIAVVSFTVVFWYIFRETPSLENRQSVRNLVKLPQYLSTVLFATACTGIILPLKSEMRKPKQFGTPLGVLNMSTIPIAILYAVFGFFGYLKYGDDVKGSITLNLPENELLAQGVKGLYSVSVFITFFLCYYVIFDIVWKNFLSTRIQKKKIMWEYVVRTSIPLITFLFAYAIPDLESFISLVGAFGISPTSLVIPVVLHTVVFWDAFSTSSGFILFCLKNLILLVIGLVIFVTGVIESVNNVIELYTKNSTNTTEN